MGLRFGGSSGLQDRVIKKTPWGFSQIPKHKKNRARFILVYNKEHVVSRSGVSIADIRDKLQKGDFVTFYDPSESQLIFPVKKIIVPDRYKGKEDTSISGQRAHILLESVDFPEPIPTCCLGYALPGPRSEPNLYKGAEVTVKPEGQVTLYYPDLDVRLLLRTRELDEERRKEHPEHYENELFVFGKDE